MTQSQAEDDPPRQQGRGDDGERPDEVDDPWERYEENAPADDGEEAGNDDQTPPPRKRLRVETPEDYYTIVDVDEKFVKKYQATTYDYRLQFRDEPFDVAGVFTTSGFYFCKYCKQADRGSPR